MNNVSPLFGLLEWLLTVLGAKCKLLTRIIHGNPVGCGLCLAPLRCHRPCFPCHSVPASIPASTALTTPRCFLALATSWPWKAPFGSLHCWLLHVPSSDASLTSASVARPSHPSRSKFGSPLFILTALCFSRCPSMVCNYLFIILLIGLLTCWQPIYPIRAKNMFIVFTVVFITLHDAWQETLIEWMSAGPGTAFSKVRSVKYDFVGCSRSAFGKLHSVTCMWPAASFYK